MMPAGPTRSLGEVTAVASPLRDLSGGKGMRDGVVELVSFIMLEA